MLLQDLEQRSSVSKLFSNENFSAKWKRDYSWIMVKIKTFYPYLFNEIFTRMIVPR
jgi:hypothetical protein